MTKIFEFLSVFYALFGAGGGKERENEKMTIRMKNANYSNSFRGTGVGRRNIGLRL